MRGKMKEHGYARVAAVPQIRTDEIMMAVLGGEAGDPVVPPNPPDPPPLQGLYGQMS